MVRACLVDVYDTILTSDYQARRRALTSFAGAGPDVWEHEWLKTAHDRGTGRLSMAAAFAQTLSACGIEPVPPLVAELVRMDAELLVAGTSLYDDTAVFFAKLRSRGLLIALVSNCSQSTRQMLEHLGVVSLADSVILSCEVGSLKPSPGIYVSALDALGVAAADAVMIDDHARFCVGAQALGMRAIQIARPGVRIPADDAGFPVVTSLLDVPQLL
jgi:putative hydrolase of the HAD superfamily